jgi:hypothetical protein
VAEGVAVDVTAAQVPPRVFLDHVMPGAAVSSHEERPGGEMTPGAAEVCLDEGLKLRGEGYDALPPPLAGDANEPPGQVDVGNPEAAHLGNPEAREEHYRETEAVAIPPDVLQKIFHFF